MHYIVLDLEWNQPVNYSDAAYKEIGDQLLFELIQIGAVKLNEKLEIVSSFSQMIRPTYYVRLHPRIRRITHIEQDQLEEAPEFSEAMDAFLDFCGEDHAFITWGCDDISVLYQNMNVFHYDKPLGKMYDLQRLYSVEAEMPKNRFALQTALENMQITADENKPFHNALNDAYYTALIMQKIKNPLKVFDYSLEPKKLKHTERRIREQQAVFHARNGFQSFFDMPAAKKPPCICCGQLMKIPEGYVKIKDNEYCALADCKQHGLSFIYLKEGYDQDHKRSVIRTIKLSDEQNKAYIATKHWQWKNRIGNETQGETK